MNLHGYITRKGGLLTGVYTRALWFRCLNHSCNMQRVASVGGHSPHYYCRHCAKVYVLLGDTLVPCETPLLCVNLSRDLRDRRKKIAARIVAGPMGRGLL